MRTSHSTDTTAFPWAGLLTLSALIFVSVTGEFLPTGLLPDMARELAVSESQVGLLITLFAGTVVLSAAPLTALTHNHSRKALVIVVLLVFVLGNLLAAVAPNYGVLAVARVISGLAHGLFWAVVGAYSAHLVPRHQIGRAVAITGSGATAAFVLGVPLGTALGHALGWRLAFGVIAVVILLLILLVVRHLPAVDHREEPGDGEAPARFGRDASIPAVIAICAVVVLVIGAHNILFTYIAPYLIGPVGLDPGAVAGMLFLYGGAGALGLLLAGLLGDRFPRSGITVAVAIVVVAVLAIGLAPHEPWIVIPSIVIWSVAFGGTPAMLQTRMLHTASARVRDIASAYLTTSFNIAIGGGALIGGILLDRISIRALPFADVAVSLAAIVVLLGAEVWRRRRVRQAAESLASAR